MVNLNLKVPPVLVFLISLVGMVIISRVTPNFPTTITTEFISLTLITIGILLGIIGVGAFRKAKTTVSPMTPKEASTLVKNGIYQYTRNPMYLGLLVILIGIGFRLSNGYTFIFSPVFMWYMTQFQIKPEEQVLNQLFGDEYEDYKKQVRRWL